MLETPKIVYSCNHIVDEIQEETTLDSIMRDDVEDYDIICQDYTIAYVFSVYQISESEIRYYYENVDFIKYTHNKIKWISDNRPTKNSLYSIEYKKIKRQIKEYEQEECPRCMSNGWYVNLIDQNKTSIRKVSGTEKLIQDFIKILLTYKVNGYGSTLHEFISTEISDEEDFSRKIINVIYECEVKYKQIQKDLINTGAVLEPSEKLKSASVLECEYDRDFSSFFLSILISSEGKSQAEINLKL